MNIYKLNQLVRSPSENFCPFHLLSVRIHHSLNMRDQIRLLRRLKQVADAALIVIHI
jgi:hypothetical protein